jgi:hypothetical protein
MDSSATMMLLVLRERSNAKTYADYLFSFLILIIF